MSTYKKYEFCIAMDCSYLNNNECQCKPKKCVYTAKEFHKWLKLNNYKIQKMD
jgi:hypothetical protein